MIFGAKLGGIGYQNSYVAEADLVRDLSVSPTT